MKRRAEKILANSQFTRPRTRHYILEVDKTTNEDNENNEEDINLVNNKTNTQIKQDKKKLNVKIKIVKPIPIKRIISQNVKIILPNHDKLIIHKPSVWYEIT